MVRVTFEVKEYENHRRKKKGHYLKAVPNKLTRPTSDKVRQAIFNIIGPFFSGGNGLDLYAGSGTLGIESLSRGLAKVVFIDNNKQAIRTIHENLQRSGLEDQAEVYLNHVEQALKVLKKRMLTFSIIFLDPPYKNKTLISDLKAIQQFQLLEQFGTIVVEHENGFHIPDRVEALIRSKHETYGNTAVSIFTYIH